ncbi:MAG: helix-turn-helix transcriptional regulator [Acetatifactor sp.]|nr:helix-turn-helix transcriptional regulator [Acetatifactor sp.]
MEIYKTDTMAIKKRMIEKGIKTITELSDITGVNRNTLSKVLSGKSQPSSDVMEKLVYNLDFTPQEAGPIFFKLDLRRA